MPTFTETNSTQISVEKQASVYAELEGLVSKYSTQSIVGEFSSRLKGFAWNSSFDFRNVDSWFLNEAHEICNAYGLKLERSDPDSGSLFVTSQNAENASVEFATQIPSATVRGCTRLRVQHGADSELLLIEISYPFAHIPVRENSVDRSLKQIRALSYVGLIDPDLISPEVAAGAFESVDPSLNLAANNSQIHIMTVPRHGSSPDLSLLSCDIEVENGSAFIKAGIIGPGDDGSLCQRSITIASSKVASLVSRSGMEELMAASIKGDSDALFGYLLRRAA